MVDQLLGQQAHQLVGWQRHWLGDLSMAKVVLPGSVAYPKAGPLAHPKAGPPAADLPAPDYLHHHRHYQQAGPPAGQQ
jgi:hypothetical protein